MPEHHALTTTCGVRTNAHFWELQTLKHNEFGRSVGVQRHCSRLREGHSR